MTTTPVYAFDPTGVLAANKIVGEQQVLTAANFRDFHFIVPTYAPFFADGMVVKHRALDNTVRTLVEGIDYYLTHWFISASRACAKPIFGSISFLDLTLNGVIETTYQTLGGDWLQDAATIAQILGDTLHNPRTTAFDQAIEMPYSFPVIDHQWDLTDLVGASAMVAKLAEIEAALRATGDVGIASHVANLLNPHQTTKTQVGLGNVQNYPVADGPITVLGTSANHYVTPFGLKAALDAGPTAALATHAGRSDNPHAVTAAQIGAYTQNQVNTLLLNKLSTVGVAFDTSRFDGKTAVEYRDFVLLGTSANTLKLNGMTAAEYKDFVLSGKAADSSLFDGHSYAATLAEARDGDAANALHFGGLSPAQYKADVLSGTASNSALFLGMNQGQWEAHLGTLFGASGNTTQQAVQNFEIAAPAGDYWIELGRTYLPAASLAEQQDLHWLIAGGDSNGERLSSLQYLTLSTRGANPNEVSAKLMKFYGVANVSQLGWTQALLDNGTGQMEQTVQVWLKTKDRRALVTVTELSKTRSRIEVNSPALVAEPAGITYLTVDADGLASKQDVATLRSDVETFITAMTTAFDTLVTTVTTQP